MFKCQLLQQIYVLSNRDLVERAMLDLSFNFLELVPETTIIHVSSLTKIRRLCLKKIST